MDMIYYNEAINEIKLNVCLENINAGNIRINFDKVELLQEDEVAGVLKAMILQKNEVANRKANQQAAEMADTIEARKAKNDLKLRDFIDKVDDKITDLEKVLVKLKANTNGRTAEDVAEFKKSFRMFRKEIDSARKQIRNANYEATGILARLKVAAASFLVVAVPVIFGFSLAISAVTSGAAVGVTLFMLPIVIYLVYKMSVHIKNSVHRNLSESENTKLRDSMDKVSSLANRLSVKMA